jgi:hypothetical protein
MPKKQQHADLAIQLLGARKLRAQLVDFLRDVRVQGRLRGGRRIHSEWFGEIWMLIM